MFLFLTSLLVKQHVAQVLQGALLVSLPDEEGDVVVGASVGYHANRDVLHGIRSEGFEAQVTPVQVAYNTYNAHVAVNSYGAVLLQFVHNLIQMGGIVNAHTYPNL